MFVAWGGGAPFCCARGRSLAEHFALRGGPPHLRLALPVGHVKCSLLQEGDEEEEEEEEEVVVVVEEEEGDCPFLLPPSSEKESTLLL